jgi:hypothetical protein
MQATPFAERRAPAMGMEEKKFRPHLIQLMSLFTPRRSERAPTANQLVF